MFSFPDQIDGHSGERGRDHFVDEIRRTASQVVGQIADDGFISAALLDRIAESFGDIGFLAVAKGVGLPVFA